MGGVTQIYNRELLSAAVEAIQNLETKISHGAALKRFLKLIMF